MGKVATDGPIGGAMVRTFRAEGGDLTRGYGVMQGTADDQVKTPTGAAVRCAGVMAETTKEGKPGPVVEFGETVAVAGAVIAAGDMVKVMATGKFEPGNAADVEIVGKAVTSAAADTDEFVMFVLPIQKRT